MTTTIAQQLKIKDFPFIIKDKNGNSIYCEYSDGYWSKREYDAHGNLIYYEDSSSYWIKREYDANGNLIYYENSDGKIIDNRPKQVELTLQQFADSYIFDKRPKQVEVTLQEIADKMGIKVEQLRIKD